MLHLFCPLHSYNGGVKSFLTLVDFMRGRNIQIHHIPFTGNLESNVKSEAKSMGHCVSEEWPPLGVNPNEHIFIYMNDYAPYFGADAEIWKKLTELSVSVQISINLSIGKLYEYEWLGDKTKRIYFQNHEMASYWRWKTKRRSYKNAEILILPPPVDVADYLEIDQKRGKPLVVSRLAVGLPIERSAVEMYQHLRESIPEGEFWFMDTPPEIRERFKNDNRFHLFEMNEIAVVEFLAQTSIFCVPVKSNWPALQGPRSLVEAMASGIPCVCVDRLGPADRINHGKNGFLANDSGTMAQYVIELARNKAMREKIGRTARETAKLCTPRIWIDHIFGEVQQ